MTDPEQDDVFEAYLKRRAVLPALDHELEPPAALDEAVLAKAREAIQPGDGSPIPAVAKADADRAAVASADVDSAATPPRAEPGANTDTSRAAAAARPEVLAAITVANRVAAAARPEVVLGAPTRLPMGRPARWAVPVALAATILLCLSVVINISLNTNRPRSSPTLERAAAARADSKASALSNATAESNAAAGVDAQGSGAAQDRFANNGERPQSVSGEIASREVVLPRAKVAGVQAPHAPVEVESASSANASSADAASSAQRGDASGATGEATSTKAAQAPADEPRVAAADKAVMMAKRAGVAAPEYTPAPEAARAAGQAVAKPEAAVVARAADQTASTDANQAAVRRPAAAQAVTNQRPRTGQAVTDQAPVVAPAGSQAMRKSEVTTEAAQPADPKVWLQQINALRAAGKKDQAEAEMRRFKAAFPDYAIPAAPTAPTAAPAGPVPPIPDRPK